jgi:hypothetical protein
VNVLSRKFRLNNAWLLAAILAFSLTLWISVGFYLPLGFGLLTGALILMVLAMTKPDRALHVISFDRGPLRFVFFVGLIAFLLVGGARNRSKRANAEPIIDVLTYQRDGVHALLDGTDPYVVTHADPYPPELHYYNKNFASNGRILVGYPYLPLSLLCVVPGYLMGDVRDSDLVAVVLTALLIFWMGENVASFLAGILLLAGPRTPTVIANGWTECIMVLTLAFVVYCAMHHPRWLPVALGLFLASKQYSLLAVPVVPFLLPEYSWKKSAKLLLQAVSVAAAITLPFALWNLTAFWHDVVLFHISQPFRPDSLSYSALLFRSGVGEVPVLAVVVAIACSLALVLRYAPRNPGGFACAVAFLTAAFVVFNKQAFLNYYFFVTAAQCVGFAALNDDGRAIRKKNRPEETPGNPSLFRLLTLIQMPSLKSFMAWSVHTSR